MNRTGKIVEHKLYSCAALVEMRRQAFLDNPDDPETNHKFRVSIRTLRSLIDFTSPWLKNKKRKIMMQNLKEVVKVTSYLRELDVLEGMVRDNEAASSELIEYCAGESLKERQTTLDAISSPEYTELLESALALASDLPWKKDVAKKGLKKKDVRKRFNRMVKSLQKDLNSINADDYEFVHETRKRVKQARYVAEQFEDILDVQASDIADNMKSEQDRLGAICDARVNQDIIAAFSAREDVPDTLVEELTAILS